MTRSLTIALVMAGLECASPTGLAGGLALWISCGLALAGLGLALWVLEARRGPLTLAAPQGGYERTPFLAAGFLVFGLSSVGLPGTLGFFGGELLADGVVGRYPVGGFAVIAASGLAAVAVLRLYSLLFCGARDRSPAPQRILARESVAFAALVIPLIVGGILPDPFVRSRAGAAAALLRQRTALVGDAGADRAH